MSHTPTPWKSIAVPSYELGSDSPKYLFEIITPDNSEKIALLGQKKEDNANFIVRACNAHDDLVKAVQIAKEYFSQRADILDLPHTQKPNEEMVMLTEMEKVLNKVGAK